MSEDSTLSATSLAEACQAGPQARFLSGRSREQIVPLAEPVEIDGVVWEAITCRKLTARELDAFWDLPPNQRRKFPTADVPDEVMAALDAEDAMRVREVAFGFFPQSWRTAIESIPETSVPSSPSSPGT